MKKRVLITGGSSDLGIAIISKLIEKDYEVITTAYKNIEKLNILKDKIDCYKVDFTCEYALKDFVEEIKEKYSKIDILINCAALSLESEFEHKNINNFNKVLSVNLVTPFYLSSEFGKIMYENKTGNIINISSTNGVDTNYVESLEYDSSKAALNNLTRNLARQFAPYVNVNSIALGWVENSINKEMNKEFKEKELDKILLKRFAKPEEIASVVLFLISEDSSYINGTTIRVDGGN